MYNINLPPTLPIYHLPTQRPDQRLTGGAHVPLHVFEQGWIDLAPHPVPLLLSLKEVDQYSTKPCPQLPQNHVPAGWRFGCDPLKQAPRHERPRKKQEINYLRIRLIS